MWKRGREVLKGVQRVRGLWTTEKVAYTPKMFCASQFFWYSSPYSPESWWKKSPMFCLWKWACWLECALKYLDGIVSVQSPCCVCRKPLPRGFRILQMLQTVLWPMLWPLPTISLLLPCWGSEPRSQNGVQQGQGDKEINSCSPG